MQPPAPAAGHLEVSLLGPVEASVGGRPVPIARQQIRALLAVLTLNLNRVVSTDRVIDALWGEHPPATAPVALYGLVSALRKQLEPADAALVTRAPGYMLELPPERIDLGRFELLAAEGRDALSAGDPETASSTLREALALWRGPPLHDLAFLPFVRDESGRLQELQLAAQEDRIDADLACGRSGEVIPELERLIADHPLRERLRAQLMLALYRAGRQADALAAYRDARQTLVDELGLDPSQDLQELERAILQHDPALATPAERPADPAPRNRRPVRYLLLAAAVGVAAIGAVVLATRDAGGGSVAVVSNGVAVLENGSLVAAGEVGAAPSDVATTGGSAWVTNTDDHTVSRIDPATGAVRDIVPAGAGARGVAADEHGVWVANSLAGTVTRIDPRSDAVVETIPVGTTPTALAIDGDALWVVTRDDQMLTRLDARTGRRTAHIPVGSAPSAVAVADGAVWVADDVRNAVFRVEPGRKALIRQINVGSSPVSIASSAGSLWVANSLDGTVSRIDPKHNAVTAVIPVGEGPRGLAVADDGVWVSNESDGTLELIDTRSNTTTRTVRVGQRPEGLAIAGNRLLVAMRPDDRSHRGGTLRILVPELQQSLDPAEYAAVSTRLYDGLVGIRQAGGADGLELVPNLAVRIPPATDGGRTYTFHLRPGIRYSTGGPVEPTDIERSIKRELRIGGKARRDDVRYYIAIRGAEECLVKPPACDLSHGIVSDDAARTITFHLRRPDPDFLYALAFPLAFAVPAGTPIGNIGSKPLPSTGPYKVRSFDPKRQLTLVRNPYFHEWSPAAHPDGYVDRIVVKPVESPVERIRMVERGAADLAFGIPPPLKREVATQYASQLHVNPVDGGVTYLLLNENAPPFNDVRARRAVNFAADRAAGSRASRRAPGGDPTCQIVAPGFPGHEWYCPYTTSARAGRWVAPDLRRARRLVAASGTSGARVSLWVPKNHRGEEAFIARLFRRLGYRVSIHKTSNARFYGFLNENRQQTRINAGPFSWFGDIPSAANYIEGFYTCGAPANWSGFCDRRIDAQVRRARALDASDPYRANLLWARIDRALVDRAVVVPLFALRDIDIVSQRVGNYQYNPRWGALTDQLWVR